MESLIIPSISFLLYAISSSITDVITMKYDSTIFTKFKNQRWWNPGISWMNKYKDCNVVKGPRFLGSTTIFVVFTDAWHLFKAVSQISLFLGAFTSINLLQGTIAFCISKMIFEFLTRFWMRGYIIK